MKENDRPYSRPSYWARVVTALRRLALACDVAALACEESSEALAFKAAGTALRVSAAALDRFAEKPPGTLPGTARSPDGERH